MLGVSSEVGFAVSMTVVGVVMGFRRGVGEVESCCSAATILNAVMCAIAYDARRRSGHMTEAESGRGGG